MKKFAWPLMRFVFCKILQKKSTNSVAFFRQLCTHYPPLKFEKKESISVQGYPKQNFYLKSQSPRKKNSFFGKIKMFSIKEEKWSNFGLNLWCWVFSPPRVVQQKLSFFFQNTDLKASKIKTEKERNERKKKEFFWRYQRTPTEYKSKSRRAMSFLELQKFLLCWKLCRFHGLPELLKMQQK